MQYFKYKAIDGAGCVQRGSISATSQADADSRLGTRGLELIFCKPSRAKGFLNHSTVGRKQLIDFTFHLQQMIEAGVPLIDSLKEYRDSADHKQIRSSVSEIVDQIESGSSLLDLALDASKVKALITERGDRNTSFFWMSFRRPD